MKGRHESWKYRMWLRLWRIQIAFSETIRGWVDPSSGSHNSDREDP